MLMLVEACTSQRVPCPDTCPSHFTGLSFLMASRPPLCLFVSFVSPRASSLRWRACVWNVYAPAHAREDATRSRIRGRAHLAVLLQLPVIHHAASCIAAYNLTWNCCHAQEALMLRGTLLANLTAFQFGAVDSLSGSHLRTDGSLNPAAASVAPLRISLQPAAANARAPVDGGWLAANGESVTRSGGGSLEAAEAEAWRLFAALGLSARLSALPDGLLTSVEVAALSEGVWQPIHPTFPLAPSSLFLAVSPDALAPCSSPPLHR